MADRPDVSLSHGERFARHEQILTRSRARIRHRARPMDDGVLHPSVFLNHRSCLVSRRRQDANRAGAQVRPSKWLEPWLLDHAVYVRLGAQPVDQRTAGGTDRKEVSRSPQIVRRIFGSRAKLGAFQRLTRVDDSSLGAVEVLGRTKCAERYGPGSVKRYAVLRIDCGLGADRPPLVGEDRDVAGRDEDLLALRRGIARERSWAISQCTIPAHSVAG